MAIGGQRGQSAKGEGSEVEVAARTGGRGGMGTARLELRHPA